MTRSLKVYGWNHAGTERWIVAARSWKHVHELASAAGESWSESGRRSYGGETGNAREIELAMSAPGVVFGCSVNPYNAPFTRRSKDPA